MLGAPQVASPALCHMARPLRGVLRLLVLSAETMCGDARSMRGQLPLGNSLFWLSTGPLKKSDFFLVGEKKINKSFSRPGTQRQSGPKCASLGRHIFLGVFLYLCVTFLRECDLASCTLMKEES